MKKRNAATIMAAAMTLTTVAPAFADVATKAIVVDVDGATKTLDVRPASGQKLITETKTVDQKEVEVVKVFTREEAFNTNFTEDIKDDTLKIKDAVVVKEIKGSDDTYLSDAKYVLAKKVSTEESSVVKAEIEVLKSEINKYKADSDYKVVVKDAKALEVKDGVVTDSQQTVEIKNTKAKDSLVATYIFEGVEVKESTDTVASLQKLFANINTTIELDKDRADKDAQYFELNKAKFVLESNIDKFDIVKSEINGNDLKVEVYKKGSKKEVVTFTFKNVRTMDKDLVVNIPAKTDVDGHWAEKEIKEAMLRKIVAADANFRPKDGITRAEFAKIVTRAFNIAREDKDVSKLEEPFSDVKKGDWFYNDVVALYNAGAKGLIIGGYEDETFRPNAKITRQEAAKMIAAAYDLKKEALYVSRQSDENIDTTLINKKKDGKVETVITVANQEI